jgi:hypothetical protein
VKARRTGFWLSLLALALIALGIVFVPAFLIRPFVPQTPDSIATAFALRRWSPMVTLLALALSIGLVVWFWVQRPRLRSKLGALALVLPVLLAAWLSRQNYFEWMFAPIRDPRFVRAGSADFVKPDDMVLAVHIDGDAAAYPVPQLAYHHLINDEVGRVPIVATY